MAKGLYQVTSGDSYYVRANSEEEAEALYHVALGNMDAEDYPEFAFTDEDIDTVEFIEASTIAEPVLDLSN